LEVVKTLTTVHVEPFNRKDPMDASWLGCGLISPEFADPKCPVSKYIIEEINEIFEQDDMPCQDPREYCIIHLLEAIHTSIVWRLSKL
jgi:hypothetical protein